MVVVCWHVLDGGIINDPFVSSRKGNRSDSTAIFDPTDILVAPTNKNGAVPTTSETFIACGWFAAPPSILVSSICKTSKENGTYAIPALRRDAVSRTAEVMATVRVVLAIDDAVTYTI
jgi:hypothetical protein